ncbi:MAG: peptide chain release factor 1 [Candidatus Omnitrophica bacterium]|nr:peptide chain release factor 1 [Candidatus Omnitrophota bacterium]
MFEQLEKMEARYQELEQALCSTDLASDREKYNKLAKKLASLKEVIFLFREYKKKNREKKELEQVLLEKHDKEFIKLAEDELLELKQDCADLQKKLEFLLSKKDKEEDKNIIVEIRAGTGGLEATLFAGDLYRMYTKYAAKKGWIVEPMSANTTDLGGFKEVSFSVSGKDAYKRLKFESGVHRVQRVPTTETQGRIHTSTATVAVLVEPEEREMVIEAKDLRIDTFRSSGPGGQHMQKTDSAVRITHIPTGLVVACQDERSQIKNKNKAMRILRARLLDMKEQENLKKISQERRSQIGTGDRSEKIRTYNFPDRRITDHRINFTSYQLEAILEGDMDEISDALIKAAEKTLK